MYLSLVESRKFADGNVLALAADHLVCVHGQSLRSGGVRRCRMLRTAVELAGKSL